MGKKEDAAYVVAWGSFLWVAVASILTPGPLRVAGATIILICALFLAAIYFKK